MARLPQPGGDQGNWGTVLNDFLTQTLNTDGTLKHNSVTNAKIATSAAIDQSKIANLSTDLAGKAATAHVHSTADITTGTLAAARIGSGIDQAKVTNLTTDLAGKAAATHTHVATDIASGSFAPARLGSGTANTTTFLRGDGTWQTPPTGSGGGGGVPSTYALGRVKYDAGWPSTRPTGYAYLDWIKSSASDPDPGSSLLIAGDTITEWQ